MSLVESKNRIAWIDMAKGYGMLAVIIAHIVYRGPLHDWIYTFHMPVYFFLSGYVFSNKDKFDVFVKKKARSLLVPYFSLGIPMVVFTFLLKLYQNSFTVNFAKELVKNFIIQKRQWTLWYIACLFFLNIIFYLITKSVKTNRLRALVVLGMSVVGLAYYKSGGLPLPWNIDACFVAIPFFFVGFVMKQNLNKVEKILSETKINVLLFIVFGLINVVFGYLNIKTTGKGLEMFNREYANPIFTYISAFAGIFAIIIFSRFFSLKPIKFIGENSLVYYAWHQTIMMPITKIVFKHFGLEESFDISQPYYWCYKLVQFAVIVIVLTVPTIIIEKTNLRVLLGKRKKCKNN